MASTKDNILAIRSLNEVGRYAVGVNWSDGHDSIFPLDSLRRHCPCQACRSQAGAESSRPAELHQFTRLGDAGVFVGWRDGHETLYTLPQLRSLCGCAYCIGEPERPITGGR
jgi:DUF971 family protein